MYSNLYSNLPKISVLLFLYCVYVFVSLKDTACTQNILKNAVRFIVNFAPEIKEIISETKNLVLLGYSVPPVAQNVALQEHKLVRY